MKFHKLSVYLKQIFYRLTLMHAFYCLSLIIGSLRLLGLLSSQDEMSNIIVTTLFFGYADKQAKYLLK